MKKTTTLLSFFARKAVALTLVLLLLFSVSGCGLSLPQKEPGKLLVYTSFYIPYAFVDYIAGDKATVINMMPPGVEAHEWEPSPKEVAGLEAADLFVYNGAGMEGWVDRVLAALSTTSLTTVNCSVGVDLLHGDEEDGELHEEHAGHSHGEFDPHFWLDPLIAMDMMEKIKDALCLQAPEHTAYFEENFQQYAQRCKALDEQFRQRVMGQARTEIVVAHEAYGYLCRAYGLTQESVRGFSPDAEPTPKKMAEVVDFIRAQDIKVILFEEAGSRPVAETLARETGVSIQLLSPIEWIAKEQLNRGEDYFSVMEQNLAALELAVAP